MSNLKVKSYSDYLDSVCALVGTPVDRLSTETAELLRVSFNAALKNAWLTFPWIDLCPYGEARFVGSRFDYPNDLSKTAWTKNNTTATATNDVLTFTLGNTPANWIVNRALANVTTAFATTTAATLAVGTTSSTAAFISAQDILTAGPLEMVSTVPIGTNAQGTAATSLVATVTNATGGSLSGITAGQVDIYLNVVNLDHTYAK